MSSRGEESGAHVSKKDEEKRKQTMFGMLGLQQNMGGHPVINTVLLKYVKAHSQGINKVAFQIDLLRLLALHRLNVQGTCDK